MRLWLLLVVSFFCCLSCSFAREQYQNRLVAQGRRRRGKKTARQGKAPVQSEYNGESVFIDSYKDVLEPKPNYNVIPGNTGQCEFQGITMFDKTVWSPKPCVTCLCSSGNVVCDEMQCPILQCPVKFKPIGQCCPICINPSIREITENSGDSPVPNDPSAMDTASPTVQEEILRRQRYKEEEERLLKKDAERKRRKKQKDAEKRRKQQEMQAQENQQQPSRFEDDIMEISERHDMLEARERQEEQRQPDDDMEQNEMIRSFEEATEREGNDLREDVVPEEAEEGEEDVWLRGDVFEMVTELPMPPPTAPPEPTYAGEKGGVEPERVSYSLPNGCSVSDVIVSCENAKLISIPPLYIPELKSLNLHGNLITSIPAEAFNGVPNLEWIDLGKNRITSNQIDPQAFNKLKFLARLYMDGNLLEHIPSGLPHTLQELKLNENNLQEIDGRSFEGLSNLVILEMEGNLLSEENVHHNIFKPLKQLTYLRLGRNYFRTIPQGLQASLIELHLENNLIEEISDGVFNQSKNLNVVILRHNKLEETRISPMAWIDHANLESIDLSHNHLHLVPSFLPKSLVHLVLVGNRIERIPGYVFAHMDPGLEYLYLSFNKLDEDGVEPESFLGTLNTMTELCLDHNQLTVVPYGVNEMTALHFLRLSNNNIRYIGEDSFCDPGNEEDSRLVALRLENNLLDLRKIPATAFACVQSFSSVVIKPQRFK